MLAGADSALDFKMGRGRGRITLPGPHLRDVAARSPTRSSRPAKRASSDLADGDAGAGAHRRRWSLGIRHVLCVPLVLVRYVEQAEADSGQKRIGVLYLDSRERGVLKSPATRGGARDAGGRGGGRHRERAALPRGEREGPPRAGTADRRGNPAGPDAAWRARGRVLRRGRGHRAVPRHRRRLLRLPRTRATAASASRSATCPGKGAPAALLTAAVQGMFTVEAASAARPGRHARQDQPRAEAAEHRVEVRHDVLRRARRRTAR